MSVWVRAGLWAFILLPAGIVLHELGHYLGYIYYELPNPALAYASGGFEGMRDFWILLREGKETAAADIAPIFAAGVSSLLGPLVTIILGGSGLALLVIRRSVLGGALAFTAFFRAAPIALQYATGNTIHSDEAHIAITLGIPDLLVFGAQLAGLVASIWLVTQRFGKATMAAMIVASFISLAAWMLLLGPLVLPE
ncbi:hypothetical protein ACRAQ6_01150 [Erythrobacter sp. HA6-11]